MKSGRDRIPITSVDAFKLPRIPVAVTNTGNIVLVLEVILLATISSVVKFPLEVNVEDMPTQRSYSTREVPWPVLITYQQEGNMHLGWNGLRPPLTLHWQQDSCSFKLIAQPNWNRRKFAFGNQRGRRGHGAGSR